MKKQKVKLMDLLTEAEQQESLRSEFEGFARQFYDDGHEILTIGFLTEKFRDMTGKTISDQVAKTIVKEQLNMSYSKIVKVPAQANSERSLILRQRAALEFLTQLEK